MSLNYEPLTHRIVCDGHSVGQKVKPLGNIKGSERCYYCLNGIRPEIEA